MKSNGNGVELLHFNKTTFSIKKLIKGVYPWQIRTFSMNFEMVVFENTSQS